MRLIDADKLVDMLYDNEFAVLCPLDEVSGVVDACPTVDAVLVVNGRWGTGRFNLETGNYEKQCTRCRNFSKEYGKPYCPNCRAMMDGGEE